MSLAKADQLAVFNRRKKQRRRANQAARAAEAASPTLPPSSPSPPPPAEEAGEEEEAEKEETAPPFSGLQGLLASVKLEEPEEGAASSSSGLAMPVGAAMAVKKELLEVKAELEIADEAAFASLREICEGLASGTR